MPKFLYLSVSISLLCIMLTGRFNAFCLEVSALFGLKNQQYLLRFLELYQLTMNNLLWQIAPKSPFYILLKLLSWPSQFFVITSPKLFISHLVYTTRTNPVLQLNLNYETC